MTDRPLTVEDVAERYRMADLRTARSLMHKAGAFRIGGRLYIRMEDLLAYEDEQRAEQRKVPPEPRVYRRPVGKRKSKLPPPDRPFWWKQEPWKSG